MPFFNELRIDKMVENIIANTGDNIFDLDEIETNEWKTKIR